MKCQINKYWIGRGKWILQEKNKSSSLYKFEKILTIFLVGTIISGAVVGIMIFAWNMGVTPYSSSVYGSPKMILDEIIRTKTDLIRIIPEKYRYPLATNFLTEIFESGRADTMKEALKLYEEQLHRWKMEGKMEKLVKEQQRNNKSLWSYIVIDSFFR